MRKVLIVAAVLAFSAPALALADEAPRAAVVATPATVKPLAPAIAARHAKLFAVLRPDLKPKIAMAARILAARVSAPVAKGAKPVDPRAAAALTVADAHNFGLTTTAGADIEALIELVVMQAAKDADEDLRAQLEAMQKTNQRKAALRKALEASKADEEALRKKLEGELDSLDDLSQADMMKIQAYQERQSKLEEALSNLMKKKTDTAAAIIQNLK